MPFETLVLNTENVFNFTTITGDKPHWSDQTLKVKPIAKQSVY